jgi:hypothetical protein
MIYGQVRLGEWREFYNLWERLDQTIRDKNLTPSKLWQPTVGTINAFMISTDYETIQGFHGETLSFQGDADCMSIWREMGTHVDEPPSDELWETAAQVA